MDSVKWFNIADGWINFIFDINVIFLSKLYNKVGDWLSSSVKAFDINKILLDFGDLLLFK